MIEIKGLRITDNNYRLNGKAVEQRVAKIHSEYVKKAKACDTQFAPETLHDNPNSQGPFEVALQSFFSGSPLGVVIGGTSEVNSTLNDIIETAAKAFSTTPEGLAVSPELSPHGPNGAYGILKSQFKRIIGCAAARANADLKLWRKHYIRSTRAAAIQASKQHHRTTQNRDNDSKFDSYDYATNSQYHEYY